MQEFNSANPYQPPRETLQEVTVLSVQILPIGFPDGPCECEFFTYREFAELFSEKLHTAFKPFGVPTFGPDAVFDSKGCVRISGAIRRLTDYQITPWNRTKKWLLPFIGYKYRPASFEIVGQIESNQQEAIAYRLYREFSRNRLAFERGRGEKINMLIGLDSEASRVASMVMRQTTRLQSSGPSGRFWSVLFGVPLFIAIISSLAVYMFQQSPAEVRTIRTVLAFISTTLISMASLPAWLYSDARAAYFYRVTAAKSRLQLRAFPLIVGLLVGALVIASFIYGDE